MKLWSRQRRISSEAPHRTPDGEVRRLEQQWGVESCALCGRTLILGEPTHHLRLQGSRVPACPDCYEAFTHRPGLDRAA